ncbi:hypothetical protein J6590_009760 [Homalodisca vitripennis]|nr:hypothetical protein J6590_009760 [Homalodisca vitripennis]
MNKVICICKLSLVSVQLISPVYLFSLEITNVSFRNTDYNETVFGRFGSRISIQLDSLPKEQFKRKVVRSPLELVVSMGGTVGFFLGASLLSIAEFFHYFFIRKIMKKPTKSSLQQTELNQKIAMTMKNRGTKNKITNSKTHNKIIPFLN